MIDLKCTAKTLDGTEVEGWLVKIGERCWIVSRPEVTESDDMTERYCSIWGFIEVNPKTVKRCAKRNEKLEEILDTFSKALKIYPGVKRGDGTEFDYLRKKHKNWQDIIPLLKPAIERQIAWRKNAAGEFRPPWKNFKTWIFNSCWEETEGTAIDEKEASQTHRRIEEQERKEVRDEYEQYLKEQTTEELVKLLPSLSKADWLIREILQAKKDDFAKEK